MLKHIFYLILLFSFSTAVMANGPSGWDKISEKYSGNKDITVYRSATCGCCTKWIAHLKKHDFKVTDIKVRDMRGIKQKFNVPPAMASCHTAIIDGYIIEGHVPADDIKRLLKSKAKITGLSVPQMPVGTPGMEQGARKDPFSVIQFQASGEHKSFRDYLTY